jgi:hypothetical protein
LNRWTPSIKDIPHVSIAHNELTTMGRFLCRLTVVVLTLLCASCSSTPGPFGTLLRPLEGNSKEQSLRKQVESDSFPTAKQAGLKAVASD